MSDLREARDVGGGEDAAFADDDAVGRDERRELLADAERHLEGAQVAVVDADELRAERQRALEFGAVVDLDQHVHAEPVGGVDQRARLRVGDARHDDEDAIGAPGARLEHLVGLEQEVLAQGRQAGRLARLRQIFGPALERRRVGEDREAGGAALRIGAGQRRRVEIGADQALRRARLLDLGDERRAAFGEVPCRWPPQSRAAAARRAARRSISAGGTAALGGGDLLALVGFDAGENVAHASRQAFEAWTSRVERRLGGAAVDGAGRAFDTLAQVGRLSRRRRATRRR